ncbi:MAG: nucleotidyltransferase family protein, partial [Candidatus Aenigmarchaeota archaeon]|nr:nucleotidyltransferase family protein [Candidatus Aenigmarchaeota archaeon]
DIKKQILPILKQKDVIRAGVFGSYARGDVKSKSDIDILIKFKGKKSLFDLARLELDLEKKLKINVDLVTYQSINPLIKKHILKEEVVIL